MSDVVHGSDSRGESSTLLDGGGSSTDDLADSPETLPHALPPGDGNESTVGTASSPKQDNTSPSVSYAPKLQRAVRKLRNVRLATQSYDFSKSSKGSEPGIDPRRSDLAHLTADLDVSVTQYTKGAVAKEEYRAQDADSLMDWIEAFSADGRAQGGRTEVTWINVNGLNGRVLQRLATKFDLHPLALEDAVHITRLSHSKANWYPNALFVRMLTYEMLSTTGTDDLRHPEKKGFISSIGRLCQQLLRRTDDLDALRKVNEHPEGHLSRSSSEDTVSGFVKEVPMTTDTQAADATATAHEVLQRLTARFRIALTKQQLSIFLTAGGTVISIFSGSGSTLLSPIFERLGTPGTTLRTSEDPSMLLHAILDTAVDEIMEIAEEFRFRLDVLEGQALLNADPKLVRHLHILSSQLLMLKRSLTPIHTLDDVSRSVLAMEQKSPAMPTVPLHPRGSINEDTPGHLSLAARLYMQDIEDHLEALVESLELFSSRATALVDLLYNDLSFEANRDMSLLTLVTVCGLPLTFVTGYFGMNFAILPTAGVFPEGMDPYGPNPTGHIAFFWTIIAIISGSLVVLWLLWKFGPNLGRIGLRVLNRRQESRHPLLSPHVG